jgi:DNA primase
MASKEFISKLKESVNLVDLIGETVVLRRSGKYMTGLSPFTKEKTPSFFVNPESQSFFCYSTNQGGDAITFLELTRGMSFIEAVNALAQRAGIPLEVSNKTPEQIAHDRKIEEEKKLLYKLNRVAAVFYQEQFNGSVGALAREYALKRGISKESLLAFGIGYAPDAWTVLRDYFIKIQAPLLKAYDLGLFRTKGGEKPKEDGSNLFDTFRNRLLFPIRDPSGEVLGFGGRWLGSANAEAPKYLNSPESVIYEKERVLYNLDQARKSIREQESVVLVEGYMDCLSLVQAGFSNVVANCGTALTKTQASTLRKLAPKVICLYDSDVAGQAATERAMNLFLENEGFPLLGASLPDGKDPDDFLKSHGENGQILMAEILQNSPALLDIWMEKMAQSGAKTLQARTELLDKIANKLSKLRDDLWIQARLPVVCKLLEVDRPLVIEAIRKYRKSFAPQENLNSEHAKTRPTAPRNFNQNGPAKIEKAKRFQGQSDTRDFGSERKFLANLLRLPDWSRILRERHAQDANTVLPLLDDPEIIRVLQDFLQPLKDGESEEARLTQLSESCREHPGLRNLFAEAMMKWDEDMPPKNMEGALARLKDEKLKRMEFGLLRKIGEADQKGDAALSEALLLELMELRRRRAQK